MPINPSKTPRCDAVALVADAGCAGWITVVPVKFAEQLERELNAQIEILKMIDPVTIANARRKP